MTKALLPVCFDVCCTIFNFSDVSEVFKSGPLAPEVRQLVQQNKVDESAESL